MVAVVSGSGLGLFGSSTSTLGGAGADGNSQVGRGRDQVFVNTTTGNLIVQSVDETLTALGLDFAGVRTYNSQGLIDDDNNDRWRLGVHMRLSGVTGGSGVNTVGSSITKFFGDGAEVVYTWNATRSRYESTDGDGANDYLSWNAGNSRWTWTDGSSRVTEEYEMRGGVMRIRFSRDADNNTVTYNYNAAGTLLTSLEMAGSTPQTVSFDYSGVNLSAILVSSNGVTQTLTRYYYAPDGSNRLRQVVVDLTPSDNTAPLPDVNGDGLFESTAHQTYITTYTYEGTSKRIQSITQTDGSTVSFTYENINDEYRLRTVTDAENRVTTFTYENVIAGGGGGTQQTAPANPAQITNQDTTNIQHDLDVDELVRNEQQTNYTPYTLNTNSLTTPPGSGGWGPEGTLEQTNLSINSPRIAYANNGNGVAAWRQGSAVYVQRYTASTNTWGTATLFSNGTGTVNTLKLAMDAATGAAMVAWTQTVGTSDSVSAAYLNASGTWTQATGFDSATVTSPIFEDNISVAVFGTRGAVSYVYNTATAGEKRVELALFNSGVLVRTPDLIDNVGFDARYPSVAIDNNGNAIVGWQEVANGGGERVYYNRWNNTTQTFSGAQILDTNINGGRYALVAYDAQGNALAIWRQSGGLFARRMLAGTTTWDTAIPLQTLANNAVGIKLAMDTAGNAIVGWTQSDGTVNSMYARIFTASTGTWGSVALLENDPAPLTGDDYVTVAINGTRAVAAWLQSNGTRYDVYSARFENGTWLGRELMETRGEATSMLGSGIDGAGNSAVTWLQADGLARSMWQRRYTAGSGSGTRYYSVPAGATWRSIAATLYGIDSSAAGTALQNAMPAGTSIASGSQLLETNLPAQLQVPYFTTVPDYYLVPGTPATPTWRSIAAVVYGIDSAAAGTALQTVMQAAYPNLSVGLRIMGLPESIEVPTQITLPYHYHVVQSADWATTVQAIYGVSDPGLIEAVKAYSGVQTETLIVGSRLHVQPDQIYTAGGTGTGPAIYRQTHIDDPLEFRTTYTKDDQGRLIGVETPVSETRYTYHSVTGNVETITQDPNGLNRVTTFIYDPDTGLLKDTRDSLGNTVSRTYNSNNQLETESSFLVRDPDGAGGQLATSPLTSRYFYDGQNHLRYAVSADGRVTEHVYNGSGQRTTTYKYAANRFTGPFTTGELDSWAPAQRAAALELTEYEYDFRGNVEVIRKYQTTNSLGAGTGTPWTSRFTYDQRGQLISSVEAFGVATGSPTNDYITSYTYDGLGRSLKMTSWVGTEAPARELRSIVYMDATQQTVTTFAGGRTQTDTYNLAGDLINVTLGPIAVGSTIYTYDANGRERVTLDAEGVKTFCFYDDAGRKIGYVDGDGSLTEIIYNRAHQVVKTVSYATRLSGATMTSLYGTGWNTTAFSALRDEANPQATTSANRISLNVYDVSGVLVYTLEQYEPGSGTPNLYSVTQNIYDGAGRLTDQVRFAGTQTVDPAVNELLPSAITVSTTHTDNRRTRFFYNADGQLTGALDGAGYLKENIFDAAGRLVTQFGYFNAVDVDKRDHLSLTTMRPGAAGSTAQLDATRDLRTRFFYDAQGRKIGELDGERYLTEFTHDVTTNVRQTIRYDRQLTDTNGTTSFGDLKLSALAAEKIHTTRYTYNGLGQVLTETNFEGTETRYVYDVAGNLITTTRASNLANQARTTQARYDVLGRLEQVLSVEGSVALAALPGTATSAQIEDVWDRFGVRYTYDNLGRRTSMTVRPNDTQTNVTRYYYDNDGRLRFELDPLGHVSENRYDAFGQLVDRIEYWRTVSISGSGGLLTDTLIGQLTGTESANVHEKTTYAYTLRGAIKSTLTAAGATTANTYNVFGEVETSKAGTFDSLSYTYDKRGLQKLTTRAALTLEDRTFDAFGRLTTLVDRGNTSSITYDRLGRQITTSQTGDANTTLTSYDAFSRVYDVRDKLLNTTSYRYDDTTRTVTVTTPEGIILTTVHNVHGDTVTVTANGNTTVYDYDDGGRLETVSDNLGTLESRKYDRAGRQIEAGGAHALGEQGTITTFEYDASNRLFRRIVDSASGGLALVTTYEYDATNRWLTVSEPGDRVMRTEYDRDGRVAATVVDPGANQTRVDYVYDAANNTTLVTEGTGGVAGTPIRRTLYKFDSAGRRTDVYVDPSEEPYFGTLNLHTQYVYDDNDNLVRKIDAENDSTWYVYDAQHRLLQTIDALGGVSQLTYDSEDRVVTTRRYFNTVATGALGNAPTLQSMTTTLNDMVTRSVYDRDGREKYTIDTLRATGLPGAVTEYGVVTERMFDASGRVTRTRVFHSEIQVPGSVTLATVETALGSSLAVVHPEDHIERNVYDVRGRLEIKIDGSGAVTKYQYDASGNVTQTTEYANSVPVDGAARVHHVNGSNHSLSRLLGNFAAGEVLTATVRFKSPPGVTGMMFLGSLAPYTNYVQTSSTAGNDGWQTLTLNLTTNRQDNVYVYVYADYYTSNDAATVLYDDLTVTSNTRGTLIAERFDSLADGWSVSGQAEIVPVTLADLGNDAAIRGFVNSLASSTEDRVTKFWYDTLDRERFVLDAEGYLSETRHFDSARQQLSIMYAVKPTLAASATLADVASAVTAPAIQADMHSTTSTTDAAGRVVQVTDTEGRSEYFVYDGVGNKIKYVNKKGSGPTDTTYMWTYEYDANHRLKYERSPSVTFTSINPTTLAATEATAQVVTFSEYDALGNLTARTEAHGTGQARTMRYEYDVLGRQTAMVSPTVGVYDAASGDTLWGNGTAVSVTENQTEVRSETVYDVFGNAIRSRLITAMNAATPSFGTFAFKAYDNLGRVKYEIDNQFRATSYTYDTFGNVVALTRHAAPLTSALPTSGSSLLPSDVTALLTVSATNDRTIQKTYDRLGRELSVRQPSVRSFAPSTTGVGGTYYDARPTTDYVYNAFGDVIRTGQQINATEWAYTYSYYDKRGFKSAEVDAKRYLTKFEYDETGDLKSQVEYARPTTGTLDYTTYGTINVTTNATHAVPLPSAVGTPDVFQGYDREVTYTYDRLNRKTSESQRRLEYSTLDAATPNFDGVLTTTFGYDVLGNQTMVKNDLGTAYTFYDVLGRVVGATQPGRELGLGAPVAGLWDTTARIPFMRMARDAHGNLVQSIEYYRGLRSDAFGATPPDAPEMPAAPTSHAEDRTTTLVVDNRGNVVRSRDASGADRYASYNTRGDMAKDWQPVTNAITGAAEAIVKIYRYDSLGQQTQLLESQRFNGASTDFVTRISEYNAFGEIVAKYNAGTVDGEKEYFDYDAAGRVWRSNTGDGVDKVFMYDLAGSATLEMRSKSVDLNLERTASAAGTYTSVQNVLNTVAAADLMRTETVYDTNGNVVERRMPTFDIDTRFAPVADNILITTIGDQVYVNWAGAWNSQVTQTFGYRVAGSNAEFTTLQIVSAPVLPLSGGLMGANVTALTAGQPYEFRIAFNRGLEPMPFAESTGTFRFDRVTTTTAVISQTVNPQIPALLNTDHVDGYITWAAPSDTTVAARLRINGGSWIPASKPNASTFQVDARTAIGTPGGYNWDIEYLRGSDVIAKKTGTLTSQGTQDVRALNPSNAQVTTPTPWNGTISNPWATGTGVNRTIGWNGPATLTNEGPVVAELTYSSNGGSQTTITLGHNGSAHTLNVNWSANTYQYVLRYKVGERQVAQQSGEFVVADAFSGNTARIEEFNTVPNITVPPISAITGLGGGTPVASWSELLSETVLEQWDLETGNLWSYWSGAQQLRPTWAGSQSLAWVEIEYMTLGSTYRGPEPKTWSGEMVRGELSGFVLSESAGLWDIQQLPAGGCSEIMRLRVYTAQGGTLIADSNGGVTGRGITWTDPQQYYLPATVYYENGTDNWVLIGSATRTGDVYTIGTDVVPSDRRIKIEYQQADQTWPCSTAIATYTYSGFSAPTLSGLAATSYVPAQLTTLNYGNVSGPNDGTLRWTGTIASGGRMTIDISVNDVWVPMQTWTSGSSFSFDFSPYASTAQYLPRVYYRILNYGPPSAPRPTHMNVGWLTARSIPFSEPSMVTINDAETFNSPSSPATTFTASMNGTGLSWSRLKESASDTVRLTYWRSSGPVYTQDFTGLGPDFSSNFPQLPDGSGTLFWRIDYLRTALNQTNSYARASGQMTLGVQTTRFYASSRINTEAVAYPSTATQIPAPTYRESDRALIFTTAANSINDIHFLFDGAELTVTTESTGGYKVILPTGATNGVHTYSIRYQSGANNPYALASGTINVTNSTSNPSNATISVNVQRNDNSLSIAPTVGLGFIDYEEQGFSMKWSRTTTNAYEAQLEYWSQSTPGTVLIASMSTAEAGFWVADLRSITNGTYGYRIKLLRKDGWMPLGIQEGTFTRTGATTGAVTVGPDVSTLPTPVTPKTTQKYDRWGNVIETVDTAGNLTSYRYNGLNLLVQTLEALDRVFDRRDATTGASVNGTLERVEKTNSYDLYGRLIETQDGYDQANRVAYNAAGQVLTKRAADWQRYTGSAVSSNIYDTFGNLIQSTDELGYRTRYKYDEAGRATEIFREIRMNAFSSPGDPTITHASVAGTVQRVAISYDAAGRRITETNGENETITYAYDFLGNVTQRRTALGFITNYGYDFDSRKTSEVDAIGSTKTWSYDAFGNLETHGELNNATVSIEQFFPQPVPPTPPIANVEGFAGGSPATWSNLESEQIVSRIDFDTGFYWWSWNGLQSVVPSWSGDQEQAFVRINYMTLNTNEPKTWTGLMWRNQVNAFTLLESAGEWDYPDLPPGGCLEITRLRVYTSEGGSLIADSLGSQAQRGITWDAPQGETWVDATVFYEEGTDNWVRVGAATRSGDTFSIGMDVVPSDRRIKIEYHRFDEPWAFNTAIGTYTYSPGSAPTVSNLTTSNHDPAPLDTLDIANSTGTGILRWTGAIASGGRMTISININNDWVTKQTWTAGSSFSFDISAYASTTQTLSNVQFLIQYFGPPTAPWVTHVSRVVLAVRRTNIDGSATINTGSGGGDVITYNRNFAGLQSSQTSAHGKNIEYSYDRGGNLTAITDTGVGSDPLLRVNRVTSYRYDTAGRMARESVIVDDKLHQDSRYGYDAHNRVSEIDDSDYREKLLFDVNGNRAYLQAFFLNHAPSVASETIRYTYDEMSRVTQKDVHNLEGIAVTHTTNWTFNARGDRVLQVADDKRWSVSGGLLRWSDQTQGAAYQVDEQYIYDGLGRLEIVNRNTFHATSGPQNPTDILLHSYSYDLANRRTDEFNRTIGADHITEDRMTTTQYDDDGRTTLQTTRKRNNDIFMTYVNESQVRYGDGRSTYGAGGWSNGFDDANNLRTYQVQTYESDGDQKHLFTYKNNYLLGESYLDLGQDVSSTGENHPQPGHTVRTYNVNRELVQFKDLDPAAVDKTQWFVSNQAGQVLTTIKGDFIGRTWDIWKNVLDRVGENGQYNIGKAQYFFYAQGNLYGSFGQLQPEGMITGRFDVNSTPISDSYPSAVPSTVITQSGDTLRTVAARVFGDASLWYVIAEENGLTDPDAALGEGMQLRIPNNVLSLSNQSNSFKPFDIGQVMGDTTPSQPPPPQAKGCGVLGMIIMIVVMIVVTVYTAGAAAGMMGATLSSTAGAVGAAGAAAAGGTFATGLAALGVTGTLTATAGTLAASIGIAATSIAAGVVGGALGSAFSQGVGIAMGNQQKFDWKQVGMSALGSGIGAGFGAATKAAQVAAETGKITAMSRIGSFLGDIGSVGRAGLSSALTQGLGVATGLQSSFSWKQVAVAAVSAPVKGLVGGVVGAAAGKMGEFGSFLGDFAGNVATGYINKWTGGKAHSQQILADAFGNALGNSIVNLAAEVSPIDYGDLDLAGRVKVRMHDFGKDTFGKLYRGKRATVEIEPLPPDSTANSAPATPENGNSIGDDLLALGKELSQPFADSITALRKTLGPIAQELGPVLQGLGTKEKVPHIFEKIIEIEEPYHVLKWGKEYFTEHAWSYDGPLDDLEQYYFDYFKLGHNAPDNLLPQQREQAEEMFGTGADALQLFSNWANRKAIISHYGFSHPDMQGMVRFGYDLTRGVMKANPLILSLETGYQLQSGEEMYSGEPISRMRTGIEFMTALVTMKLVDAGMNLAARKFIGESKFAIGGNALRDRMKLRPNPHGPRADNEVAKVADANGVDIPDDVRFVVLDDKEYMIRFPKKADTDANYGYAAPPEDKLVHWKGWMVNEKDKLITVYMRRSVLDSDEHITAVVGHEVHEIQGLRTAFTDKGGAMMPRELQLRIEALHMKAELREIDLITRMRQKANGGN